MRVTVNLDDEMMRRAAELTGIEGKTALVKAGLEALVSAESARRLILLGGTMPWLENPHRRRSRKAARRT